MAKYFVVNTARRPQTRFVRKKAPKPEKFMQILCGGRIRIARKRHQALPESLLEQYWDQLKAKWEAGAIEIHEGGPKGPLFVFGQVDKAEPEKPEVKEEPPPAPAPEVQKVEPVVEEPVSVEEKPNDTWTKSQLADWLLDNVDLDPKPDKAELMKLTKADLLELVE